MKKNQEIENTTSFRYYLRLNETDNTRFLDLYERSGAKSKSDFIRHRIFQTPFRVISHDASAVDFYVRLTHINAQIRKIGMLYNQAVRSINVYHSVNTARVLLSKLEVYQENCIALLEESIRLTTEFNTKWLPK
ncbi:MAG: hypothetical protein EOM44_04720 [Bacteroidia bacterium]|nr:hypothetical protein [Bacteroidia bacterium]